MFERFTDKARRVLVRGQEEARLLGHNYIGTEHVLLGLTHDEGVAARTLAGLDITVDALREKVESTHPPAGAVTDSPPFTPEAKGMLEDSLREALQLGHSYIGTEHLLLAIAHKEDYQGARVLLELGADLDVLRAKVIEILESEEVSGGVRSQRLAGVPGVGFPLRRTGTRRGPGSAQSGEAGHGSGFGRQSGDVARAMPPAREAAPPVCPYCGGPLAGGLSWATIDATSAVEAGESRRAIVFYCTSCGTTLGLQSG